VFGVRRMGMYRLMATGDFFLNRTIVRQGAPNLDELWRAFHGADHVFANLEGVLTNSKARADKLLVSRAEPELAVELRNCGLDVVNIANNHGADFGLQGLTDTIGAVRGAGVEVVGGGSNLEQAFRPAVLEAAGRRVAFLGFGSALSAGSSADVDRWGLAGIRIISRYVVDTMTIEEQPGMAPFVETIVLPGDLERAVDHIRKVKSRVDLLVVGIHWGVACGWVAPFQDELATYQQPVGRALIEAGADAVIGHHSHCLHGVEVYSGRPIFYSLGNTLFHFGPQERARRYPAYLPGAARPEVDRYGGVVQIVWDEGVEPTSAELWPLVLNQDNEPALASGEHADNAIKRVTELSVKFGTRFERDADILKVRLR
jgi:poly-gamma-glutamate capsule biosynthesis protein CapA/YwtB (metallophosphatase superfamily)